MNKLCRKCGQTKSTTAFHKHCQKKDGLQSQCKNCDAEYRRINQEQIKDYGAKYRRINQEKIKDKNAAWQKANRDKTRASAIKWHKNHPDKSREYSAKWRKLNVDKVRDKTSKRRALKLGATTEKVERAVVYERDKGFCYLCGRAVFHERWHLHHIISLAKGGEHSYRNVVVTHPGCNMRKGVA